MEDIYVVSVGARERLREAAERAEDRYVVRAGLESELLRTSTFAGPRARFEIVSMDGRASATARSGFGRA